MKRAELTLTFRRRMLPLVAVSSIFFALAAPLAFFIENRAALVASARSQASQIAEMVRETAERRPKLWRYNVAKLEERLAALGLDSLTALVVYDERGSPVAIGPAPATHDKWPIVWGHAQAIARERTVASVWVGMEARRLILDTLRLLVVFILLASIFAVGLFLVPMHAVRKSERQVQGLLEELAVTLPENERRRIARELHDGVGQALTAARLHLLTLKRADGDSPAIATVTKQIDESIDELRRATAALSPPSIEAGCLRSALERHCQAYAHATGLQIVFQAPPAIPTLGREVETACYRIVQEALSNVAKHAVAQRAWVRLEPPGAQPTFEVEISDDGRGFDASRKDGVGLSFMRERAESLGGSVSFAKRDGGGAQVRAIFPVTIKASA
jgi:signal transduction histidine kinase